MPLGKIEDSPRRSPTAELRKDTLEAAGIDGLAILSALPDPVLLVGRNDAILFANTAAEQLFRASLAMLNDRTLPDIIPHDSPILLLTGRVRRGGSSMSQHGVRLETPRIGEHVVRVDAAPMPEMADGVVLTLKEQSIAGKIDRSLTHRDSARSITAMAALLAHEIKNPLSGVRGAAQLLEQSIEPDDRQLTRLIVEESDRIVSLIDKMEVFTGDSIVEDREAVNIHEVLERVIAVGRAGFAGSVTIVERYDPSLPPVYGNRDRLIQAFLNLLKNATEAAPENDGEVIVTTAFQHGVRLAAPGGEARLRLPLVVTVQDNGAGIPEDLRRHIFDPFVTTKRGGTGLGLPLVAKLIGDHGGVIDVESRPRRTLFRVMLPIMREGRF